METLTLKTVLTAKDALLMAQIRNECREFMTRDPRPISPIRQLEWFETEYLPEDKPVRGYLAMLGETPIGFGLIRLEDHKLWVTGGLKRLYRGKGYGRQLFTLLTEGHAVPVYLEVLIRNTVARNLYASLGFVSIDNTRRVVTMRKL